MWFLDRHKDHRETGHIAAAWVQKCLIRTPAGVKVEMQGHTFSLDMEIDWQFNLLGSKHWSTTVYPIILSFDKCMRHLVILSFNAQCRTESVFVGGSDITKPEHASSSRSPRKVSRGGNCGLTKAYLNFGVNQAGLLASTAIWMEIFVFSNKVVDTYLFGLRISSAPGAQYISPKSLINVHERTTHVPTLILGNYQVALRANTVIGLGSPHSLKRVFAVVFKNGSNTV